MNLRTLSDCKSLISSSLNDIMLFSAGDMPFFISGIEDFFEYAIFFTYLRNIHIHGSPKFHFLTLNSFNKRACRPPIQEILASIEIEDRFKKTKKGLFILFENNKKIEDICKINQWLLLHPLASYSDFISCKGNLKYILHESEVPSIYCEELKEFTSDLFTDLAKKFSLPFVIQKFENNTNGKGTWIINSTDDWMSWINNSTTRDKYKICQYVDGLDINVSACVTRFGIAVHRYFYQLVGLSPLTKVSTGHCGNDTLTKFQLPQSAETLIYEYTTKIGNCLKKIGFFGVFGIDFRVDRNYIPHVIEINGRFQTTSSLVHALQLKKELPPFFILQIAESLRLPYFIDIEWYNRQIQEPVISEASQVVFFYSGEPKMIQKSIPPGIYELADKQLRYLRPGYTINDLQKRDELLINRTPEKEYLINDNDMLCIVQQRDENFLCEPGKANLHLLKEIQKEIERTIR